MKTAMLDQKVPTRHVVLSKELLEEEVLKEIRKDHRLTKCPFCKGELEEPLCSMRVPAPKKFEEYGRFQYECCESCQIIWCLELFNWTNERGDGMITGYGHMLILHGWTNCVCKSPVFGSKVVTIEEKSGHHASLFHPCPG